ncbi:Uncharacterized protein Fot_43159 [Forsythia ovata]|uniref:Uncharacterized protein n=1 Tax=Forsythia ovata TaxID=205694 RepID=A0ABD1RN90_9LAMI
MKEKMKKRIVRSQNLIQVKLPITIPNGSHSQGIAIGDFRKFMKNRKANLKSKLQNRCKSRLFADHFKMVSYLPPFHTRPAKDVNKPSHLNCLCHPALSAIHFPQIKFISLPFRPQIENPTPFLFFRAPPPRREEHSRRTTTTTSGRALTSNNLAGQSTHVAPPPHYETQYILQLKHWRQQL